ncbi:lipid A deacylase LpxR family protein [Mucilaginibacter boryungensis]|uniref:Lipid A deacylase LpxR family protein n=1 Tax=Mucilaginibacter boryungensis TaxID=768480 RepID=A0ABR9XEU0_9SPHI|nr:lipid A deacylase LpxR family protein [Mucilaginibacter boryungensis]MBE9665578.1 lipid A deacylase LpxR family protein [Mucilaginibacter boryungensis]
MRKLFLITVVLILTCTGFAQSRKNEVGIQADNDSFLGQGSDRYYTNGIFIYYRHALKVSEGGTKLKNKVLGFEAGQKIFNPQSGSIPSVDYLDRPFAGYLYIGSTLNFLYSNESNLKFGAQIGVVGPGAGGKEIQEDIHKWFGFYPPTGWEHQVHDGAELNLSAEYNKLLTRGNGIDLTFNSYGNLGNGFTGAGAGLMLRAGNFNQLFNSVSTQSTASNIDSKSALHQHEFFAYYKPALNYVAYDATIQGSLFNAHNNPQEVTLDREPFIFSNQIGGAYTANHWVFDVSVIFHSKDVKQMVQLHQWGSVTVLYRF